MDHSTMATGFTNSHTTTLYSSAWTPKTQGQYAGTCIFLIILGILLRSLWAGKTLLELRWRVADRNRRYVAVRGRNPEASRVEQDSESKDAALITANGVEENVRVVQAYAKETVPFRLSVDVPRAAIVTIIVGISYLL